MMGSKKRRNDKEIPLAKDHKWKCTPGYMLIVADGGVVRFEAPSGWYNDFWEPGDVPPSIRVCDGNPPDDDCRIVLSVTRFPFMDIDSRPISRLHPKLAEPQAHHIRRPGYKLAWAILDPMPDKNNGRSITTFVLYGLAPGIQCILSMAIWEEDYEKRLPLWLHVVETFDMANHVTDISTGASVRPTLN